MQAVVLCGGEGTRLRPLTKKVSKPMVIINKKPFLEHLILFLKKNGIKNFVFCAGYLWRSIKDYFHDGSKFGVKITYSIEKELLGTGGALKLAEKYLRKKFLVIYGDSYLPINYRMVYDRAEKFDKIGVLVVYDNRKNTHVMNNIVLSEGGLILKYDKINFDKRMQYVDAGVVIFKKKVLDFIPPNEKVSLEGHTFKRLIKIKQLAGTKTNQRFYDIGTYERLKEIKKILR